MRRLLMLATLLAMPAGANPSAQQYAGMVDRPIMALSPKDVDDLRGGRGMGLALAAEMNGYPGPLHVLEHATALGLDAGQRATAARLTASMRAEAIMLGERLIAEEGRLDALFRQGGATAGAVADATAAIGATQGALRAVHLATHLERRDALDAAQLIRYAVLRGYTGPTGAIPGTHSHGTHR